MTTPKPERATVPATPVPDFEQSLAELETIVEKLEQGDFNLEESLRQFERGITLTRACQSALKQAEQKVEILVRKSGEEFETTPFTIDEEPRDR